MLHRYRLEHLQKCFGGRRVVYIGDSTIRQLFWATARKLDAERAHREQHLAQKHTDMHFQHEDLSLVYIWDPFLNTSILHTQLESTSLPRQSSMRESPPAIIVVGGGLWHARYLGEDSLPQFIRAVDKIAPFMSRDRASLPRLGNPLTILAPVQIPWYESLDQERNHSIKPARVEAMNEHLLRSYLERRTSIAWAFSLMSFHQPAAYDRGGLHVVEDVAERMVDTVFNTKCNTLLARSEGFPMDKTCCTAYPPPTWAQRAILASSAILLPLLLLVAFRDVTRVLSPFPKVARALAALAMAVCYCYCADRTQTWGKAHKQFDPQVFSIFCAAIFALGFLSLRRSSASASRRIAPSATGHDQPFFSRDQTDELKGWMQFLILIYHYLGASRVLPVYEVVRLLVAAYLYMTGFGHAVFFSRKGDYSFRRTAGVLLRLNMLSAILPFVMRTDYLFYYFAPLTSFWYMIVYVTMRFANHRNGSLGFVTGKVVVSALLVNAFIRAPRIFEDLFGILERCCNIHWNAREWRFRLQLDSYIVFIGMFCGQLFIHITDALKGSGTEADGAFARCIRARFQRLRSAALVFALVTPALFCVVARRASDKYAYNAWMPYISTPAILSYIVLRNYSGHLRNYHSSIFAWMGRHSLETFTLQFHIWLAADTKGLLKTGMLDRWVGWIGEFVVLTVIFLWVCWHVGAATQTLTSWIVDPSVGRDESGSDGDEDALPQTKSPESLTYPMRMASGVGAGAARGASGIRSWIAGDLRRRVLIILLALWLLNMVSQSSFDTALGL